jgi:hypothetical protein
MKNSDIWWDGHSLVLTGGGIIEQCRPGIAGQLRQLAADSAEVGRQVSVCRAGERGDAVGGSREVHFDRHVAVAVSDRAVRFNSLLSSHHLVGSVNRSRLFPEDRQSADIYR